MNFTSAISHSSSRPLLREYYIPPISAKNLHKPINNNKLALETDFTFSEFDLDLSALSPPSSPVPRSPSMSTERGSFDFTMPPRLELPSLEQRPSLSRTTTSATLTTGQLQEQHREASKRISQVLPLNARASGARSIHSGRYAATPGLYGNGFGIGEDGVLLRSGRRHKKALSVDGHRYRLSVGALDLDMDMTGVGSGASSGRGTPLRAEVKEEVEEQIENEPVEQKPVKEDESPTAAWAGEIVKGLDSSLPPVPPLLSHDIVVPSRAPSPSVYSTAPSPPPLTLQDASEHEAEERDIWKDADIISREHYEVKQQIILPVHWWRRLTRSLKKVFL